MATCVERVRIEIHNVAEATPGERRQRLVALYEAAVDLRDLVARYQDWLVVEDAALMAVTTALVAQGDDADLTALDEREDEYLRRVLVYQAACDVLSAAYAVVRDDARVVKRTTGVQAPLGALGEAPF